jgi:cation transport ATPase
VAGGALVPFLGIEIFGWLPMLAAIAMAMSSVTVVGNSILLGRYKPELLLDKRTENKKNMNEPLVTKLQ